MPPCSATTGAELRSLRSPQGASGAWSRPFEKSKESAPRIHNPTTPNRQGWDLGSQYRSAVFVHGADQMTVAVASRDREQQSVAKPIVTQIEVAGPFYQDEEYHQQYFDKQGGGACAVTIKVPKPVSDAQARD